MENNLEIMEQESVRLLEDGDGAPKKVHGGHAHLFDRKKMNSVEVRL